VPYIYCREKSLFDNKFVEDNKKFIISKVLDACGSDRFTGGDGGGGGLRGDAFSCFWSFSFCDTRFFVRGCDCIPHISYRGGFCASSI